MSRILSALKRLEQRSPGASAEQANGATSAAGDASAAAFADAAVATVVDTATTVSVALAANHVAAPAEASTPPPVPWLGGRTTIPVSPTPPRDERRDSAQPAITTGDDSAVESRPATIPISAAAPARQPSKDSERRGRRAADRYVVTPQYAALCERILTRIAAARSAAVLILPADASADAGTVVAEMALSLAQITDEQVLAIDADVHGRGPDDGDGGAQGLCNVLAGEIEWHAALGGTRDRRLQLLPAGRLANESLARGAMRMTPILAEAKTRYRLVLVHGSATAGPLDLSLVRTCDLAYLVVHQGHTTQRAARRAKRRLEAHGGVLHGCILTGVDGAEAAGDLRAKL